jgi:hypothetical protein
MTFLRLAAAGTALVVALLGAAWWIVLWMPASSNVPCTTAGGREDEVVHHLTRHVTYLAGSLGPRSFEQPDALAAAADYVETELARHGWRVTRQGVGPGGEFVNVVADAPAAAAPAPLLVVGAHYDTVAGSPGADDNASGVAVLLEIARLLGRAPRVPLRLIAFTNEEDPLGNTEARGSLVAAAASRRAGEDLRGMIALESLGFFTDAPDSQHYPAPLAWFLPDRGDYVAFVARPSSRTFLHETIGAFRTASRLPAEGLAVPQTLVRHVRRSDNAPYWDHGYQALMITDTAEFRNPHYHRPSDLPPTLDFRRAAQATLGIAAAVECVARRSDQPS